jgi:hypothetical protein
LTKAGGGDSAGEDAGGVSREDHGCCGVGTCSTGEVWLAAALVALEICGKAEPGGEKTERGRAGGKLGNLGTVEVRQDRNP